MDQSKEKDTVNYSSKMKTYNLATEKEFLLTVKPEAFFSLILAK